MGKNKKDIISITEPTESELNLYNQIVGDLTEEQLDEFANQYFDEVAAEKIKCSFPKYIISQIIRPVQPGDTIQFLDEENTTRFLFCLVRKDIESKTYLLFSLVDNETETLMTNQVYLFRVVGYDENDIEEIDIVEASEDAERILDIMEADSDVVMAENPVQEKEE